MRRMGCTATTLRLADQGDSQAIALMSRDLIETGLGWAYRPGRVRRLMADRSTTTLVACDRAVPVGFGLMQLFDDHAHLVLMAVRAANQRRGVGRQMMQWLLESAQAAGVASVHLELRAGNGAATDFYRAMGFRSTLVIAGYYNQAEAALRMVHLLRKPQGPPNVDWLVGMGR